MYRWRLMMGFCFLQSMIGASISAQQPFEDVTKAVGLKGVSGGVAAWGDFNNDGWVDLFVNGQLWRNDKGKFTQVKNIPSIGPGIWGDFDNDGYLDLFGWSGKGTLLRNLKGKGFEAVKGLPQLPTKVSLAATWGDFNGDGFLDLYVCGYEVWPSKEFPDVIWLNRSGKGFVEHWRQKTIRRARGATIADFDEDGDIDLYISNYRLQANLLFQNDGKGNFKDIATESKTAGDGKLGAWGHTIGSSWGDFDNDGHIDLFVGNFSHPPAYQDRPKFLKNLGPQSHFHFEDKTKTAGLHWQESYASPTLGDFDNDTHLDLFFTTVYAGNQSVLYRNTGNWKFVNTTSATKVNTAQTYQAAWADFDNDGSLDLITGGKLYRNPGGKNHWLKVRLVGSGKVNAAAIGTSLRISLGEKTLTRQVEGATGQGNQNDLTLHFGLGSRADPVKLEIRWTDGSRQFLVTPTDRTIAVKYRSK